MPARVPFEDVVAGDSWSKQYELRKRDKVDSTVTLPMHFVDEGWTDWMAMWRHLPTSQHAIVLAVDASSANDGILIVSATPAQTRDMGESGVWDLQATRGAEVKTWLSSGFNWESDVTRV